MKRVVLASLVVAAVGLVGFNAPAKADNIPAVIIDNGYRHGECANSAGGGVFDISVGDTITWTNCGLQAHTVTGNSFGNTNDIPPSGTFSHTFNTVGEFPYHCDNHSSMTGTVNVAAAATTTTATTEVTVPPTTATTAKPATTTTSTIPKATTTTEDIDGVFDQESTTSTSSTTIFTTDTTRALGAGGESGTSAGVVALLLVGLIGVGTAVALIMRRMRGADNVSQL